MSTTSTPKQAEPAAYSFMGARVIVKASSDQTDGRYCLLELHGVTGDQPPLHVHHRDDEGFYVIEGELRLHVGADTICLGPGGCVVAPRGVPHTYVVESKQARWLVASNAGFDRFVRKLGRALADPADPVTMELPPIERILEASATHGIDMLGPPGTLPS